MCDAGVPMGPVEPQRVRDQMLLIVARQKLKSFQNGFREPRSPRIARAVGRLGTGTSSNCRSEGVRAAVRSLVRNKLSPGSLASLGQPQR